MTSNPYEHYNNKLGIKVNYLISDRNPHRDSLKLISYRAFKKRMDSNTGTERQLRRASLNMEALVLFSSLTQEWRDAITVKFGSPKEEIKKSWFAGHFEADRKAFDFYAAHRYGEDNKKLDPALIERYTYNASVLNAVIKCKTNRKAYAKALGCTKIDIWESLTNDVNAFRDVDHNLPSTSRGLRNKINDYIKYGYIALISGKLQNQNAAKVVTDQQGALLDELLAKHTNLDNAQVASLYNAVASRINWKTITPQTVANIKEERNLVVYAARNGKNRLLDNMLMQNKRQAPKAPMLYWTLDGWDAELLYQKTTTDKRGYSVTSYHNRLTMVTVLDPFNKYPVGYAIGTHETPDLIKAALRNALMHVKELFGNYYRPYQLQSDNYGKGALKPVYGACSVHYTPARVKNAKAKVIEPWFNRFNKEYLQMFDNWSGHNVSSGSKNQPNDEMLNKLAKGFPDENGCRQQLISAIEADRAKKQEAYLAQWQEVAEEYRSIMSHEMYLQYLGQSTGYTNRLQPDGLTATIDGLAISFDSFDMNFRKLAHLDWAVKYDPADLSQVLVLNAESRNGKIVKEVGTYQFMLERKYIQPMALAERNEGDGMEQQRIKAFNDDAIQYITDEREKSGNIVRELFQMPQLQDTLAKLVLVDSKGSHKDRLNENRIQQRAKQLIEVTASEERQEQSTNWATQQHDYHKQKVNLNDYL